MPEINLKVALRDYIWDEFQRIAKRRRRKPEKMLESFLQDYLERVADEDLLERSSQQAKRAKFRIEDTEEIVREYRRQKAAQKANGHTKKAYAGRP